MCSHVSLSRATSELGLKPLDPPRPLQSGQRETRALVQNAGKSCEATETSGLFLPPRSPDPSWFSSSQTIHFSE